MNITTKEGQFDKAYAELKREGYEITTTEELAMERIKKGEKDDISQCGSYVAEAFIYLKNGDILITDRKHNPILKNPAKATQAHEKGEEFSVSIENLKRIAQRDVKKAIISGVLLLKRDEIKNIPVDELHINKLSMFLLRDTARDYGKFLKDSKYKINEVPIYTVDKNYTQKQDKPFARLLWLWSLDFGSVFVGGDRGLHGGSRVRGVRQENFLGDLKGNKRTKVNFLQKEIYRLSNTIKGDEVRRQEVFKLIEEAEKRLQEAKEFL